MTAPNNFKEYYKTVTDSELLSVLDNVDEYQPSAIEAAKEEFARRQLSYDKIQEARKPLVAKQEHKQKEKEKIKAVENKIKSAGNTLIDTINPIQSDIPSTERTVRLIVIVFAAIFIFQFIKDFQTNLIYAKHFFEAPLESSFYLMPQVLLPVATFTFWKRKTLGWTLLTIFLTFSAAAATWLLYQSLTWRPSGLATLDRLFPRPSFATHLIQLVFLVGVLYVLCTESIRDKFLIDKQRMSTTIVITAIASFVLIIGLSLM